MEGYLTLHQIALDTLSITAISTECERVFSGTKKLVNSHRCSIKEDPNRSSRMSEGLVGLWNYYTIIGEDVVY
jgi:hAT family C-terminal dimerisation region